MSILLVVVIAAAAVGGVSFLLKLILTRGIRRVENVINTAIADTTDIANGQALPERWRDEVARTVRRYPAARRDEAAKRLVLQRLDRLITQVERGSGFEPDARVFASDRLRSARERWATLSWAELAADAVPPSPEPSEDEQP